MLFYKKENTQIAFNILGCYRKLSCFEKLGSLFENVKGRQGLALKFFHINPTYMFFFKINVQILVLVGFCC